jgi:FkbH-like protein
VADPSQWRADGGLPGYAQAVAGSRELDGLIPEHAPRLEVIVGGNCNTDFMLEAMRVQGWVGSGMRIAARSTGFGAAIQLALSDDPPGDAWVLWFSAMGCSRGATARPTLDVHAIAAAVSRLLGAGKSVVVIPPEPLMLESDPASPFSAWRQDQRDRLIAAMPDGAVVMPTDEIRATIGVGRWHAPRYWAEAKCPCHPDGAAAVGAEAVALLCNALVPAVRALVVDLDDTLWGGRIGEVDAGDLALDPDGAGRAFLEMQRWVKDQAASGVPVGVVSKNDDDRARLPFAMREEMILSLDDIVMFSASWDAKHEAIRRFAQLVNVGIDAVCFIDDSPIERDEARAMLPGLIVPELPARPDARVPFLMGTRLFLRPPETAEDAVRTASVRRSVIALPGDTDVAAYLSSLGMELIVEPLGPANLQRAASLIQKTNQFNLNGVRVPPGEIAALASDERACALAFRLRDAVGDHGVIAVVLGREAGDIVELSTWVISCRVFNRGVEWAIVDHLLEWSRQRQLDGLLLGFQPTDRNAVVASVVEQVGTRIPASAAESIPHHHIEVTPA